MTGKLGMTEPVIRWLYTCHDSCLIPRPFGAVQPSLILATSQLKLGRLIPIWAHFVSFLFSLFPPITLNLRFATPITDVD